MIDLHTLEFVTKLKPASQRAVGGDHTFVDGRAHQLVFFKMQEPYEQFDMVSLENTNRIMLLTYLAGTLDVIIAGGAKSASSLLIFDERHATDDNKAKFINDHYDGKHSDGLENGAKKFDYSAFTVDHYDDKGAKHKDVPVAKKA